MSDRLCDSLDDYLGGWLAGSARAEFESHLDECGRCQDEVARQERLDGLLARANDHLETVPPHLVDRIDKSVTVARWRSRAARAVAGLSAAAVLLFGVLLWPHRPESVPVVTDFDTPIESDEPTLEPPAAVQRTPSQQLATLVASHCGSACPSPHRWTKLPLIAAPTRSGQRAFSARVLKADTAAAGRGDEVQGTQRTVRSSSATIASCVQARQTLGARRFSRLLYR